MGNDFSVSNDAVNNYKILAQIKSARRSNKKCPSLTACLKDQPKSANGTPIVVEACLRYFETAATDCLGLFRVPGNQKLVDQMWKYMEQHPCARLSVDGVAAFTSMRTNVLFTPHEVASFLKRFLRSMKVIQSVITPNCHDPLINLIRAKCPDHLIVEKCSGILRKHLAPTHRALVTRLCDFLLRFSRHESRTQMNCANLATCFMFLMETSSKPSQKANKRRKKKRRSRKNKGNQDLDQMMCEVQKIKFSVSVIENLITHSKYL